MEVNNLKLFSVRVPEEKAEILITQAKEKNISLNKHLSQILLRYLEESEKNLQSTLESTDSIKEKSKKKHKKNSKKNKKHKKINKKH